MTAHRYHQWRDAEQQNITKAAKKRYLEERFSPVLPPLRVPDGVIALAEAKAEFERLGLK